MMLNRQTSAPYQSRFQESRERAEIFSSKMSRSVRNQEHNEWLQMKADELDRLFAEHKCRIENFVTKSSSPEVDLDEVRDDRLVVVRGKLYDRYMQKRDLKLREKWEVEREVREMKMKAMSESLERSSAMLKTQYSHSKTTTIRDRDQLVEKNLYGEEEDKQFSDSSSMSYNSKRNSTKKSMFSSTGSTSTSTSISSKPIPRPYVRKENTKPSTAISKTTTNAQPSSFYRSKSTSGGIKLFKEEKPAISSSSKKPSASPLKPSRDQPGMKPSMKKWNDTRPDPEARTGKQKTTMITAYDMDLPESVVASPRSGNSNALYSDFADYSSIEQPNVPELPNGNSVTWNSDNVGKTRKKWGNAQVPVLASDASHHLRKDTGKGIIRFLQFGRKSRGAENVVDDLVATDLEVDDNREEEHSSGKLGCQVPSYGDGAFLSDQDISMHNLMIQKLKEERISAGSPRASRSFFSLPSFRNRGDDSKLGR